MKITDIKTYVVGNPPPHFGGRYWTFLKLTTDNGIEGFGEVYAVPFDPHVVARMIEDVFERCAEGSDPFKIEKLWRIVYSSGYTQHPDLSLVGILSGIEMACWDIIGKALDRPVYELLGGRGFMKSCDPTPTSIRRNQTLPTFTTTPIWQPKEQCNM
jgi:2-dehydro-3-deoxyphosphogalactonate aldolase